LNIRVVLEHREFGRLLQCGPRVDSVEIGFDLRKVAETELGLLYHVERRALGAIDQAEVGAQHPSIRGEIAFDDLGHVG